MDEEERLEAKEEKRKARERTRRYMNKHFADGETRAERAVRTNPLRRLAELEEINREMERMGKRR